MRERLRCALLLNINGVTDIHESGRFVPVITSLSFDWHVAQMGSNARPLILPRKPALGESALSRNLPLISVSPAGRRCRNGLYFENHA